MKRLIILFLIIATPLFAQWKGEGKGLYYKNITFDQAIDSTYTLETINLLDFVKVDYSFSVAGADSVRWLFRIDKSIDGNWVTGVVTDSLAYGGTTGVSDLFPATGGLIRNWTTDNAIGTELIRFVVVASEVDSTAPTSFTLQVNGKR